MTSKSKANADTEQAQAGAGASGVNTGVSAGQSAGVTGAAQGGYSELGFKSQTDIGTEEAQAIVQSLVSKDAVGYSGSVSSLVGQNAVNHNAQLLQLSTQALQNAIETANMVSKNSIRHTELAADRQWNVDETNAFAASLGIAVANAVAQINQANSKK